MHDSYSVTIHSDDTQSVSQCQEYFVITDHQQGRQERVRLHDYGKIYSIPGLYELIYTNYLQCRSPQKVCSLFLEHVAKKSSLNQLRVLDLGAGNGMIGELLRQGGIKEIYGIDIEDNAKHAAERDRPGVYQKYYTVDMLNISPTLHNELLKIRCNGMTSVANLGFNDIQVEAFVSGFKLLSTPAYLAFNIKEQFFTESEFSRMMSWLIKAGYMQVCHSERYCHRYAVNGEPIYYIVVVAEKKKHIL